MAIEITVSIDLKRQSLVKINEQHISKERLQSHDTVDGIRQWTLSLSDDVKSLVNKNDSVTC